MNKEEAMSIRERMSIFLKDLGISDYKFEKEAGLSKGYMNKCKNPSADVLEKLCRLYPTISAEWLLRGEGSMLRELEQTTSSKLDEALKDNNMISELLNKMNVEELVREEIRKQLNKKA